jgi:uncharacterized membrane protein
LPSASDLTGVDSTRWNVKGSGVRTGAGGGSGGRALVASADEPPASIGAVARGETSRDGSRDGSDGDEPVEQPTSTLTSATTARGMRRDILPRLGRRSWHEPCFASGMATLYSKIKVLDHPVHPMLVAFPITFFTTTLVAFIVYATGGDVTWFRIGYWANVAGVVSALVAALPGFIDWLGIPSHLEAKRVGVLHMVLNLVVVAIFAINLGVQGARLDDAAPAATLAVLLSVVGVVTLLVSGYFGWSLVQTHHVGVNLTREQQALEPHRGVEPHGQVEARRNLPHAP